MATLHKFKLLATQCATATSSPSRSPLPASAAAAAAKSPSFHLRRRKTTLRRLLSRSCSSSSTRRFLRRGEPSGSAPAASDRGERKGLLSHTSLKDLFVSSSSPSQQDPAEVGRYDDGGAAEGLGGGGGRDEGHEGECGHQSPMGTAGARPVGRAFGFQGGGGAGFAGRRLGGGFGSRFGSTAALRYRLLSRAWRPVLVTIPE